MRTRSLLTYFAALFILCVAAHAQTPEFTYQGRLVDGTLPASGTYEMRFRLFDADSGGIQQPQPTPITRDFTVAGGNPVTVANGVFTVKLDFTANAFPGAARFLEIGVRKTTDPPGFTTLTPRQPVTSGPQSVRSLTSSSADGLSVSCVLCVTDAQIQSIDGSKVTGTVANATTATNVSGIVPVANGGTGSSTKNFVDLSTNQINIAGNKRFIQTTTLDFANVGTLTANSATFNGFTTFNNADPVTVSGVLNVGGAVNAEQFGGSGEGLTNIRGDSITGTVQIANGGTGSSTKNFVDLSTNQSNIGGDKTFTGVLSGNGSGLTNLNLAGMGFSGRIDSLSSDQRFQVGGVTGFTTASQSQINVQTLSPHRTCSAMNLSVLLVDSGSVTPEPPGADNSRRILLLINNNSGALECTISGSATRCNSAAVTQPIGAGSQLSIQIQTSDGGALGDVGGNSMLFGWECR